MKDVSFKVPKGITYGIIGRNGSGKSTMLKLVAGITKPTEGTVAVDGRISALIELGAGFHPEISGRENVFINGIMLGLTKREVTRRFDEIVDFAELRDFIDAPVKTYSSGMYMRLGFAVAINVDPDVLLVDEVLAVGDEAFTHKCLDKFAEFRRRGKTILLVTHSLNLVERFCDEVLWLDSGQRARRGRPAARRVGATSPTSRRPRKRSSSRTTRRRRGRRRGAADRSATRRRRARRPDARRGRQAAGDPTSTRRGAHRHVQGDRGPLGLARGRDHRRRGASARTASAGHVFQSGEAVSVRFTVRALEADRRTSCSASASSTSTASAATARTPTSRNWSRRRFRGEGEVTLRDRAASTSSRAPTSSTSPCTASTARPTTTTGCSTASA